MYFIPKSSYKNATSKILKAIAQLPHPENISPIQQIDAKN